MQYSDQYKDPRWQKMRLEILSRDDYTCVKCGDKKSQLHVHHFFYKPNAKVWEYNEDDLVTLCGKCHDDIHSDMNLFKYTTTRILKNTVFGDKPNILDIIELISSCSVINSSYPLNIATGIARKIEESRRDGYYEGLQEGAENE